jgi:hypothetical protein
MSIIKVHDKEFVPFISSNTIQHKIKDLAEQLSQD